MGLEERGGNKEGERGERELAEQERGGNKEGERGEKE